MGRTPNDHGEQYSEQKSQERFEKLVSYSTLNTHPKLLRQRNFKRCFVSIKETP